MKILIIANCPPVEYLGSGYVIKNFSEGLRSLGHEVDIFGPEHFQFMAWMSPRANQYRAAVGMYRFVKKHLKKKDYDIIEFYGGECALAVSQLVKQKNRKFLIIHHSNGPEPKYDELKRSLYPKEFKWFQLKNSRFLNAGFSLPDGVITVSEDDERWLKEKNWPISGNRKAILPCLPDNLLNLPFDLKKKEKVFGFCGTWLPKKGIEIMQEDVPPILRQFPDWKFRIIGQSENFGKENYFPPDVLDQIEIIPFIKDKNKLIEEYQKLNIFILPSLVESFGLVLAEAMACGCATIVTKVGFAFSLTNREHALIMPEKSSPHLQNLLKELIVEEELRTTIARKGYDKVQHLNWAKNTEILERTYINWRNQIKFS